ncbi:MAG: glycosyltransferase [Candidatus Magasanikbacteria bacterium]|nr:glycosyltransferase [Candidatus Magasanikbacteria bacterium]
MSVTLTAHCLVKNEENFIGYAISSVIDFVDEVLVFDTGSTDKTVAIIKQLQLTYPHKIIFEEKGSADKVRHTALRQEMIERTKTDWFMILDGDEVWKKEAVLEAVQIMNGGLYEGITSNFYECVGDVYHRHYKQSYTTARFIKNGDVCWKGSYNEDAPYTKKGEDFFKTKKIYLLQHKFWHLTHLARSSKDREDYTSGGQRINRRILTYCIVGRSITEPLPDVFKNSGMQLSWTQSVVNFIILIVSRAMYKFKLFAHN